MKKFIGILIFYSLGVLFAYSLSLRLENVDNNTKFVNNYNITVSNYNE